MQRKRFFAILSTAVLVVLVTLTLAGTAWTAEYEVLHKFKPNADGHFPDARLTLDANGNLYGTTSYGGTYGDGTVFKVTLQPDGKWTESVLYSFTGGQDGSLPHSVIFDAAGNLYGTTYGGGTNYQYCAGGCGTVFQLTPQGDGTWRETVLYNFGANYDDGAAPQSNLIFDSAGNLYGTTVIGGALGKGTVFKLTKSPDGSWKEDVLHRFTGGTDGAWPSTGLIFDATGNLYGTTTYGGCHNECGTVFKLTPNPDGSWTERIIHRFKQFAHGYRPFADLIFDASGNLYGTTMFGSNHSSGTVFKLTPNPDGSWTEKPLHIFNGTDGANPQAGLVQDAAGNLYGTTESGGKYGGGTVFKLTPPSRKIEKLHSFNHDHQPRVGLVWDASGNLYGATWSGGKGYGVVFKITP